MGFSVGEVTDSHAITLPKTTSKWLFYTLPTPNLVKLLPVNINRRQKWRSSIKTWQKKYKNDLISFNVTMFK